MESLPKKLRQPLISPPPGRPIEPLMALKVSLVKGDWRNESQWVNCSKNLSLLRDAIDNYDADVNETDDLGRTPLMLACSYATNQSVVALLLQKGATPRTTTVVKPLATWNPRYPWQLLACVYHRADGQHCTS